MSVIFFCTDFFTFFLLKNTKGVSLNYVDTFKMASSASLDLCPHALNKLAYSARLGLQATIFKKITNEAPWPIPFSVIISLSHITIIDPVTNAKDV